MKSAHSYKNEIDVDDDQIDQSPKPISWWWRKAPEFDPENGHLKADHDLFTDLTKLTPRLRLLREMERLALVAPEGLDDLRHKLMAYRSGEFWLPVGGMKKEDMDIPPVITVLLVGLRGAGKSALVNMMYSVLGHSGLIPFAQTSSGSSEYTTVFLEEHNVVRSIRAGFCVFDSRGLSPKQMEEGLEDVWGWMSPTPGVRQNQPCWRPSDHHQPLKHQKPTNVITHGHDTLTSSRYAKRKVNVAMVVANLAEIHRAFESGDLNSVDAIKELFQFPCLQKSNENPILILTHGDMLGTEERIKSRLQICEYIGINETSGAYDIACLTEQGILPDESDPVTAFALTEAVYRSLMVADRSHSPKKRFLDWIIHFLSLIMSCIASFFHLLAHFFSKFDHKTKLKR
ncbi:OLC1v1020671C1 [Oldenlandia corymbosa var. corymbosa]|uniref:OLC1v1020671C1 n=1 Tax=Oldenlandia corymbosa var. corymbosa TaxID=529605 RepID=A0AAV1EH23_OLDCO|nr:OLC1v1020671C1 [Oldenlandia corymbosa var. corymbosa]